MAERRGESLSKDKEAKALERSRVVLRAHDRFAVAGCWDTYKEGGKVVWAGPVVIFGDREAVQTVTVLGICLNSTGKLAFTMEPRYVHGLETTLVMPGAICKRLEGGEFETPEQAMHRTVRDELGRECLAIERIGSPQAIHQSVNDAAQTFVVHVGQPRFKGSEKVIWLDIVEVGEYIRRGELVDSQTLAALTLLAVYGNADGQGAKLTDPKPGPDDFYDYRPSEKRGSSVDDLPNLGVKERQFQGWDLEGGIQG